jgi:transcriptional regulator
MYTPDHFAETRPQVLHQLINTHRLATIVRQGPEGLTADHIPLLLHHHHDHQTPEKHSLRGHVARANPLWREAHDQDVLVIFQGPQAYISPGWYASKAEHGKVVPTWNYAVVHAQGKLTAIDSYEWLHGHANALTDANEARQSKPWQVADAPEDFIRNTARAIVGIEIHLTSLKGKWKVSQNRSDADRAGVAAGLATDASAGAADMASLVSSVVQPR